jgi:hypothetical protein
MRCVADDEARFLITFQPANWLSLGGPRCCFGATRLALIATFLGERGAKTWLNWLLHRDQDFTRGFRFTLYTYDNCGLQAAHW